MGRHPDTSPRGATQAQVRQRKASPAARRQEARATTRQAAQPLLTGHPTKVAFFMPEETDMHDIDTVFEAWRQAAQANALAVQQLEAWLS